MNDAYSGGESGIILNLADLQTKLQSISHGDHQWTACVDSDSPDHDDVAGVLVWFSNPGLTDMPNEICYRFPAFRQALGGVADLLICIHPSLMDMVVAGLYFEDDRLLHDLLEDFERFWQPIRDLLWQVPAERL